MEDLVKKVITQLSVAEKLSLLSGANFWETVTLKSIDLPPIVMNDGPFGVRKPKNNLGSGLNEDVFPSTAFPTTSALASSFDPDLLFEMGQALARECIDQGVDLLLGPGLNIKRSPLCGRNFEYFSEDPLVSATMASALINGLQSKGVGATVKHYAVNSQEKERFTTNAIVDERALNEIYLKGFHDAIKKAKPYAVMCSYNQVNGRHASRNYDLLTTKLRHEVGYKGLVMSDWGAVVNLVDSVEAGLNLEMPGSDQTNKDLLNAFNSGRLTLPKIDEAITPLIQLMIEKKHRSIQKERCDYDEHFLLAQKVAENSAVLLKNDDNILPLNPRQKIALIGNFAKNPRYQGSGSSRINPQKLVSLYEVFEKSNMPFVYADGYLEHEIDVNETLLREAVNLSQKADVVVLCVGLPESYEVEGYDRKGLLMPPSHVSLITEISKVNAKLVIVLSTGSPVAMPWINGVKGILLTHLAGAATGPATFNLLYGKANPSGKLSETYPLSLARSVPGESFVTSKQNVPYLESLFVGYRYYDTFNEQVLFPFGFGLSYTQFKMSNLEIQQMDKTYKITFNLTNIGHIDGAEVVGVYVGRQNSKLYAPHKELKAFKKIFLAKNEKKEVEMFLTQDDLKCYDPIQHQWVLENTIYHVYVGLNVTMSETVFLIHVEDSQPLDHLAAFKEANRAYYVLNFFKPTVNDFVALYAKPLPLVFAKRKRPFTLENNISDTTDYWIGKKIYHLMTTTAAQMAGDNVVMAEIAKESIKELPFRSIPALSSGAISNRQRDGLLLILNGKPLRGAIKYFIKPKKKA